MLDFLSCLALLGTTVQAAEVPAGCHPELVESGEYDANQLNTAGFRCYKEKKYGEAALLFGGATMVDDKLALAHYNLACTLALLRKENKVCDNNAYLDRILEHQRGCQAL